MQYLLLIYQNEAQMAALAQSPQQAEFMQGFQDFTDAIKASGEFVGGEALVNTGQARSVRVREGKVLATDGPFAETREALGGYYLVDVPNIERAIELAAKIPSAKFGTIEVRALYDWENPGAK